MHESRINCNVQFEKDCDNTFFRNDKASRTFRELKDYKAVWLKKNLERMKFGVY